MKRKWCSLILLKSIVEEIPKFILEIYQNQKNLKKLKKIGSYSEGGFYNIEDLAYSDSNYITLVQRLDKKDKSLYE